MNRKAATAPGADSLTAYRTLRVGWRASQEGLGNRAASRGASNCAAVESKWSRWMPRDRGLPAESKLRTRRARPLPHGCLLVYVPTATRWRGMPNYRRNGRSREAAVVEVAAGREVWCVRNDGPAGA